MGVNRVTLPLLTVVKYLLDHPDEDHYGLAVARGTGLAAGTVQPILARLEDEGWVSSWWEDVDPAEVGRRPRRYYEVTGAGVRAGSKLLQERAERMRIAWRPAEGGAT